MVQNYEKVFCAFLFLHASKVFVLSGQLLLHSFYGGSKASTCTHTVSTHLYVLSGTIIVACCTSTHREGEAVLTVNIVLYY